jgi:hypothetical protein
MAESTDARRTLVLDGVETPADQIEVVMAMLPVPDEGEELGFIIRAPDGRRYKVDDRDIDQIGLNSGARRKVDTVRRDWWGRK